MIDMHTFDGLGRIDMFEGLTILWTFNQGIFNSSIEIRHFIWLGFKICELHDPRNPQK